MEPAYSVAILCGGHSSRMGEDKALMDWHGRPMIACLLENYRNCRDVILSVHHEQKLEERVYLGENVTTVEDLKEDYGPMEGLRSSLRAAENETVFVTTCDAPYVGAQVADFLAKELQNPAAADVPGMKAAGEHYDAVIPRTSDGRIHPLVAAYRKSVLPQAEEQIREGNHRMTKLLDHLRVKYIPAGLLPGGEQVLMNLNTPQEKEAAGLTG